MTESCATAVANGTGHGTYFADPPRRLIWYGSTHLLLRGLEKYYPSLELIITADHGRELCEAAAISFVSPGEFAAQLDGRNTHNTGIFAFEWTDDLRALSANTRVMLSPEEVIARGGDKTLLPRYLEQAGVDAIPSVVLRDQGGRDPGFVWERFGGVPLVIQQKENTWIGKGTHKAGSRAKLEHLLASLPPGELKIVPYLEGDLVTSAACVGVDGEIRLSCMSRQIVGVPSLTSHWASHCGNDLLLLPSDIAERIGLITSRVGQVLSELDFLGIFGLDLIVTGDRKVLPIEINPRMQSVTSLANATEILAGCVPSALLHAAAHFGHAWPEEQSFPTNTTFSQLCLYNTGAELTASKLPRSGIYQLNMSGGLRLVDTERSLLELGASEVLVTMRASNGRTVETEGRIAYLQFRRKLTDDRNVILPDIARFVDALRLASGLAAHS